MDQLWSPWRFAYVTTADGAPRPGVPARLNAWPGDLNCVFCNLIASIDYAIEHGMNADEAEEAGGLVKRGKHCFICLNAYPYTSGHVMVMPYAHLDRIAKLDADAAHELMDLAQLTERALEQLVSAAWIQFRIEPGPGGGRGRRGTSAYARDAALGGRHQLHDDGGGDAGAAGRLGDDVEAAAGDVCGVGDTAELAALRSCQWSLRLSHGRVRAFPPLLRKDGEPDSSTTLTSLPPRLRGLHSSCNFLVAYLENGGSSR